MTGRGLSKHGRLYGKYTTGTETYIEATCEGIARSNQRRKAYGKSKWVSRQQAIREWLGAEHKFLLYHGDTAVAARTMTGRDAAIANAAARKKFMARLDASEAARMLEWRLDKVKA